MKVRIVCNSKHSIPYNVFFNKSTEFSKLHKICSRTKPVLICKIQSVLVSPHFQLMLLLFVCSGGDTDPDAVEPTKDQSHFDAFSFLKSFTPACCNTITSFQQTLLFLLQMIQTYPSLFYISNSQLIKLISMLCRQLSSFN